MSVNMDAFSIDDDFEEPPIWSPFLDQTDLKVIAEALDFYLQSLDCRDPRVISVCSLIRNLRSCWPFAAHMTVLFEKRLTEEKKNDV